MIFSEVCARLGGGGESRVLWKMQGVMASHQMHSLWTQFYVRWFISKALRLLNSYLKKGSVVNFFIVWMHCINVVHIYYDSQNSEDLYWNPFKVWLWLKEVTRNPNMYLASWLNLAIPKELLKQFGDGIILLEASRFCF